VFYTLYSKATIMEQLSEQKLSELSDKWLKGTITGEELALLEAWYNCGLQEDISWTAGDLNEDQLKERLFYPIAQNISGKIQTRRLLGKSILYKAAATITLIMGATLGYLSFKTTTAERPKMASKPVINNSGNYNKAILTLADGQTVDLNGTANGIIAQEGGARIQKTQDGKLLYNADDDSIAAAGMNILNTPKGGQYQIALPDGSKVWLNASSALKFPTVFQGKERVVELMGEAYFEVAKDKVRPFKVKMSDETAVEVLGTHFNIMAYPGENRINATLLEGSINIQKGRLNKMVAPGQMAEVTNKITLQAVDAEEAISWKNGLFRFEKSDVQTVMNEIERWYNIDVIYEGGMPDNKITGYISRTSQLSEVVKMLELSGLKLQVRGNKIKVFNN
jgi:transmembrane sensor